MTTELNQILAYLRYLAATAGDDRAAGAYLYAAEQIEAGEHKKEMKR